MSWVINMEEKRFEELTEFDFDTIRKLKSLEGVNLLRGFIKNVPERGEVEKVIDNLLPNIVFDENSCVVLNTRKVWLPFRKRISSPIFSYLSFIEKFLYLTNYIAFDTPESPTTLLSSAILNTNKKGNSIVEKLIKVESFFDKLFKKLFVKDVYCGIQLGFYLFFVEALSILNKINFVDVSFYEHEDKILKCWITHLKTKGFISRRTVVKYYMYSFLRENNHTLVNNSGDRILKRMPDGGFSVCF